MPVHKPFFKGNCFFIPAPAESHSWLCWAPQYFSYPIIADWTSYGHLTERQPISWMTNDLFYGLQRKKELQPIRLNHFQEFKLINIKRMRHLRVKSKLKEYIKKRSFISQSWGHGHTWQGQMMTEQFSKNSRDLERERDTNWPIE